MQKKLTAHAAAAKAIRTELKQAFPGVKFSVRSEGFAGGDAVRISWVDGPRRPDVKKIVGKYQYGHFNGMEDYYEYSNRQPDLSQVKYVTIRHEVSDGFLEVLANFYRQYWGGWENLKLEDRLPNRPETLRQYCRYMYNENCVA